MEMEIKTEKHRVRHKEQLTDKQFLDAIRERTFYLPIGETLYEARVNHRVALSFYRYLRDMDYLIVLELHQPGVAGLVWQEKEEREIKC